MTNEPNNMAKTASDRFLALCASVMCVMGATTICASADPATGKPLPPTEAQVRFEQGLKLAAANQNDAAIRIFWQLTADYPLLPQPYVQLAALYTKQGKVSRAVDELRTALDHRLDDGSLQEDLGDLYVELARQSYRKAIDAASPGPNAAGKYDTLQKLSPALIKGTHEP